MVGNDSYSQPMPEMPAVLRTLRTIAVGFALGPIAVAVVVAVLDLGEPESPDLADGATAAVIVLGVIGLVIALLWWSRAGDAGKTPAAVQTGFIIRLAIAELGLLLGILAVFMTGALAPMFVGLGLFLASLYFMVLSLRRIEDATDVGLIR